MDSSPREGEDRFGHGPSEKLKGRGDTASYLPFSRSKVVL
jgi:hypothetical protein